MDNSDFAINIRERPVFSISSCAVCWKSAQIFCSECKLIGYCNKTHLSSHLNLHKQFCDLIQKAAVPNRFLYENVGKVSPDEWRQIRIGKLFQIQTVLNRNLEMHEREMVLFPPICSCFETNLDKLKICSKCEQVWFCRNNPKHLSLNSHNLWCDSLKLLTLLARRNASSSTIKTSIETHICTPNHFHPQSMSKALKHCLIASKNKHYDICERAIISSLASGPLTALYAATIANLTPIKQKFCIHLVGAEPHFELNAIDAWEMFFLHLLPNLVELTVVMVGPELNPNDQLPLDLLKSKPMCKFCQSCSRKVTFEFINGLYHDFAESKEYEKFTPDLICAFNPGLHRTTGFQMQDTWPLTIKTILSPNNRSQPIPFVSTAYTSFEAPRDLDRIRQIYGNENLEILHEPNINPFASQRPDRNFISDNEAPLIFKNYYLFIVKGKV